MDHLWTFNDDCKIIYQGKEIYFHDMEYVASSYQHGCGKGIETTYHYLDLSFTTLIWKEEGTNHTYYEFIPVSMDGVEEVFYPGSIVMNEDKASHYSVLNVCQGLLIPNNWPVDVKKVQFNGQMNSSAAYMPWFGHVKDEHGLIAIAITDDDMAYAIDHDASTHSTKIQMRTLASLGKMHKSISRYSYVDGDYNALCKVYQSYAMETGLYKTLKEKMVKNPKIRDLLQCSFVHKGIKKHISPDSEFYDHEDIASNDLVVPFSYRQKEIEHFHELGAKRLYLHIDGWAEPGYDNKHPDYYPVCKEAGGNEGILALFDTLHQHLDLVGLHDQYRDYYFDAPTFDTRYALMQKDGKIFEMTRWAGGHQSYICASQAKYYVKRNFKKLFDASIYPDCSYLDVFTCNEMDECYNKEHLMTRKQCKEYRMACLNYVSNQHILVSSEEVNAWAVPTLIFCHYAPYQFMLQAPDAPRIGIPVPLFNLVFHECLVIPWPMDEAKEDYMLYALINGGAPYLDKDGAYPNVDGAFDEIYNANMTRKIERANIVSSFYQSVAYEKLEEHHLLEDGKQMSVFSNGMKVIVDFKQNKYEIIDK